MKNMKTVPSATCI